MPSRETNGRRKPEPLVLTADIASEWFRAEEPRSLTEYSSIEPEAAEILSRHPWAQNVELELDGLTTLDVDSATYLARYAGPLNLNGLRKLSLEVQRALSSRRTSPTFLGRIESLDSVRLAKALAMSFDGHGDGIYLRQIRELKPKVAKALAIGDSDLIFGGNAKFSPLVKRLLAQANKSLFFTGRKRLDLDFVLGLGAGEPEHEGRLVFSDAHEITVEAACELAKYPGDEIYFSCLKELSPEAAEALALFPRTLNLMSLDSFSPAAAVALSNRAGDTRLQTFDGKDPTRGLVVRLGEDQSFGLGNVRHLTPEMALKLASAPILEFCNLKKLSPAAAIALATKHRGTLLFNGIESLSDSLAAALEGHQGGISLPRVKTLSLAAARSLTTINGFIALGGLTKLSGPLAEVLAKCQGNLLLDGLTTLTPQAARKLLPHKGILSLNGVREISLQTARLLAEKPNQKRLSQCGASAEAVKHLLIHDRQRVTMMFDLNNNGAFE